MWTKYRPNTFKMTNNLFFSLIFIFICKFVLFLPFGFNVIWIIRLDLDIVWTNRVVKKNRGIWTSRCQDFFSQMYLDKLTFGHPDVRTNWCSKCAKCFHLLFRKVLFSQRPFFTIYTKKFKQILIIETRTDIVTYLWIKI